MVRPGTGRARQRLVAAVAGCVLAVSLLAAAIAAAASDTIGKTTVEQRIVADSRRRLPPALAELGG